MQLSGRRGVSQSLRAGIARRKTGGTHMTDEFESSNVECSAGLGLNTPRGYRCNELQ
jgi:hypothetical protein